MNIQKIDQILAKYDFPKYRRKQIFDGIFKQFAGSWKELSNLPKELIEILEAEVPVSSLEILKENESKEGNSVKVVFRTNDNKFVETVLMKHKNGWRTVCLSCAVGCAMNCAFCATGQNGFFRNLTSEEIIDQVLHFCRYLNARSEKAGNIVFMGMGEPFNNYDNIIEAVRIFNRVEYLNIGMRHISVSTCGVVPGIIRFAREHIQANLAISLHAPNDAIRSRLMPINKTFPIKELLEAVDFYIAETNRKVMFEYLLIDGINDSDECAKNLASLMNKKLYHINLIKYHSTSASLRPSPQIQQTKFFDILKKAEVSVTFRRSFGEDIQAACGQLAGISKIA